MDFLLDRQAKKELLEKEIIPKLSPYFVGFVQVEEERFDLGGSGTLIAIDGVRGILTADHVLEALPSKVGLILAEKGVVRAGSNTTPPYRIQFEKNNCRTFRFGPNNTEDDCTGPDLAVFVPPPDVIGTISAKMSFYNLSMRRELMLNRTIPIDQGLWVLSGFIGERTRSGPLSHGFEEVKGFSGFFAEGLLREECERSGFDYLTFQALYGELYEGPESYGGSSGGGLWQLGLARDGEALRVVDHLLSGVAFCQTTKRQASEGLVRDIVCHGRKSIYGHLIERVAGG
jgi:hypothetical protein